MVRSAATLTRSAELLVLVEQRRQLGDLALQRESLAIDRVAALADDAVEQQERERDCDRHDEPGLNPGAADLLLDLGRLLVELGDGDDSLAAALANRQVHLEQPIEAVLLAHVLHVVEVGHLGGHRAAQRRGELAFDRELLADQLPVRAVHDHAVGAPHLERDDALAERRVGQQRIKVGLLVVAQPLVGGQRFELRARGSSGRTGR